MFVVCALIASISGVCIGIVLGMLIQRRIYDTWLANHCYFCCNKFNDEEDTDKTAAFETDLTKKHRAHLSCWERNLFSEYDTETEC